MGRFSASGSVTERSLVKFLETEINKLFMRSLTLRILVALSTFVVGIAAGSAWRALDSKHLPIFEAFEKQERKYTRGPAGEATTGSFITLYSSDGMSFTKWTVECGSPEGAKREMQKRLNKAVKIVSREPLFDQNGEQIGETVVALVPPNGADYAAATLLWTEKDELCQVEGATLGNILEYRKDFKH